MGKWRNLWNNWQQTLKEIKESGGQLDPGPGIRIQDGFVSARVDNSTIEVDGDNNLHVIGGGGGGFEPTSTQLAAMNSGINQSKREGYDAAVEDVEDLKTDKLDKRTTGVGLYSHNGETQSEVEVATSITGNADKVASDKAVKDYVDDVADDKADKSTTLSGYGITNAYTKTETDTLLNNKADKSTTYTKTEVDTALAKKLTATEADRGLNITNNKVGHSNSITAPTAKRIVQGTYDAQGHLTAVTAELNYSGVYKTSAENQLFTRQGANAMYKELTDWNYVGILGSTSGSVITVKDDWNELLFICRCAEGSSFYNLTNVVPKLGFTQGSPTNNSTFIGFFYNNNFYANIRIGLSGKGDSRQVKVGVVAQNGWNNNGIYVYKR